MAYNRLISDDWLTHHGDDELSQSARLSSTPSEYAPHESNIEELEPLDTKRDRQSGKVSGFIQSTVQRYNGWKGGLTLVIFADLFVLLCALTFILVVAFRYRREGSEAILIDGSCSKSKRFSTWLHLAINIASTILLSTSSYAMQCLTSPTRADVSRAHGQGRHLDIGVSSIRNVFYVSGRRAILYIMIVLTSVPIHLLANSTVYATQGSTEYLSLAVSKDYQEVALPSKTFDASLSYALSGRGYQARPASIGALNVTFSDYVKDIMPNMTRMSNVDCIREYTQPFRAGRRHVIAVSSLDMNQSFNNTNGSKDNFTSTLRRVFVSDDSQKFNRKLTVAGNMTESTSSFWPCSFVPDNQGNEDFCDALAAVSNATNFKFGTSKYPIEYCLSEEVPETCKLRGNIPIAIVVLICAMLKSATLFITLRTLPADILATIGDAVSSFLAIPEPLTRHCSLLDRYDVKGYERRDLKERTVWRSGQPLRARWNKSSLQIRCCHAIPLFALFLVCILQTTFLALGVSLLGAATAAIPSKIGLSHLMRRTGLGFVNLKFTFTLHDDIAKSSLASNVIFVNMPQLLLSIYYFAYNQCWTTMLIAREWASLGQQHRALRVSNPEGAQRSNYFLTIPYRFAIPLQIASAFLHWLLSQCLFLVRVDVKSAEPFVKPSTEIINAIGYSPLAVTLFISLFSTFVAILWFTGFFIRLRSPIPLVGGSSLAISAACHPPAEDYQPWLRPVKWGVIDRMERDGFKHCAITSKPTYSPEYLEYKKWRGSVALFE